MKTFLVSLRMFLLLTLLTGIAYPMIVWGIGNAFFSKEIAGSLVYKDGIVIGSRLIEQEFASDKYFHPRRSANQFATVPSGASNFSATSKVLKEEVEKRRAKYGEQAPDDLLTSSGSGLDPHLSPKAVFFQMDRVAKARNLTEEQKLKLENLINRMVETPQFGFMGSLRVNILSLNLELDRVFPKDV